MTSAVEGTSNPAAALDEAIRNRDREQTEELWMELAQEGTTHVDSFLTYADKIAKSGAAAQASLLLQMLVPDLMSAQNYVDAYEILKKAASHTPTDRDVRGLLLDCIKRRHEGSAMLDKALESSRIAAHSDLRKALEVFESFIALTEGGYVYHNAGWGVGQISEIDFETDEVFIDFKAKQSHRMAFTAMGQMLKQLEPDHLRVQLEYDPDALKGLAKSQPPELIKKVLRDEGRALNLRQVKALVVGPVISASGWPKWWTDARSQLRRDSTVNVGSGSNPTLELQREVVTFEVTMLRKFEAARALAEKIEIVREYMVHKSEADAPKFLAPAMAELLAKVASAQTSAADRFCVVMTYHDVRASMPEPDAANVPTPDQLLRETEDLPGFLERLKTEDYRRRVVEMLPKSHPETWPNIYRDLLLAEVPNVWDAVYRGLVSNKRQGLVHDAFQEVYRRRDEKAETFAWFCRGAVLGRIPASILDHSRVDFLEYLFILLDKVGSERGTAMVGQDARPLATRLRHVIFNEVGEGLLKIFEDAGQDRTRQLLGLVEHNRGLNDNHRIAIEGKAYTLYPRLDVEEETKPHEDEDSIYVTEQGLRKREDELHRLVSVELPQVAEEIGAAMSFGDLSENAEYHAAREKQQQLANRASAMEAELRKAKVITPELVREDEVCIGARVTLRNAERGFLETYTILGPWDSDFENHVISYRAALAQGLLGQKKGDTVTIDLPDGGAATYEVMAAVSAIT